VQGWPERQQQGPEGLLRSSGLEERRKRKDNRREFVKDHQRRARLLQNGGPPPGRFGYAGTMRTSLLLLLAATVLTAYPRSAGADPELDRAMALHRDGRYAAALAAVEDLRARLPDGARLSRWSIPFEG
ncbi:MAG TPA: hypothetical protein VIL46_16310, partial [Gemmataceae bacterium]